VDTLPLAIFYVIVKVFVLPLVPYSLGVYPLILQHCIKHLFFVKPFDCQSLNTLLATQRAVILENRFPSLEVY